MSAIEDRLAGLGLELPAPPAAPSGVELPFEFVRVHGDLAYVSGHGPLDGDRVLVTGSVGGDVTVEQGYEAARQTGLNCLAGMRYAAGSLDRVKCLIRNLCFVAAAPDFTDVHLVSSGCSDLLRDVFGPEAGLGGRATIGVQSLAHDHCFECWLEVELHEAVDG